MLSSVKKALGSSILSHNNWDYKYDFLLIYFYQHLFRLQGMQSGNYGNMHELSGNVDDYNRSRRNRTPSGKMIPLTYESKSHI